TYAKTDLFMLFRCFSRRSVMLAVPPREEAAYHVPARARSTVERGVAVHPPSMRTPRGTRNARGSDQARLRHTTTAAYRCFLPDLTGFAGRRCTGPDRQRHATLAATAMPDLGREFSPAGADCGYRAPLAPRLARLFDGSGTARAAIRPMGRTGVAVLATAVGAVVVAIGLARLTAPRH